MVSSGFSLGVFSPAEMLRFASFVNLPCAFVSTELTLNPPEGIVAGEELGLCWVASQPCVQAALSVGFGLFSVGPMNEENFFEWEALIM